MKNKTSIFLLTLIILIGAFLRFYKLDWGDGIFAHPDEYHIIISASQLSFPDQMHPHFFNYGTVTIYLIYFTKLLLATINHELIATNSFLLGRFYSAFFSTLTIFLIYKISQFFFTKRFALLAAFFTALIPGLIQQAHFATPESNLIFFLFGSLLFTMKFVKTGKLWQLIIASVFLGLSLGVKVSGGVMLVPLITGILLKTWPSVFKTLQFSLLSLIATLITFIIVAPFVFLDSSAFLDSFRYESGLATGQIPVFYTRQFIDTTPFLFQLEKILPFALGPTILVLGITGFIIIVYNLLQKSRHHLKNEVCHSVLDTESMDSRLRGNDKYITYYILLIVSFLSLFIPSGLLFAKWTRFLSPTFPFFAIFSTFTLSFFSGQIKSKIFSLIFHPTFLILNLIWTIAFFAIYIQPDVRTTASHWFVKNINPGSNFLLEGGNMVDVPLSGNFPKTSLDFYNLEEDYRSRIILADALVKSDYFLIQSRRVFFNHQRLSNIFPKTANFYNRLFEGDLGFEEIKEFNSYPKISLPGFDIEFPDETLAEETWSVFDHPVIRVFKKISTKSRDEYINLLEK